MKDLLCACNRKKCEGECRQKNLYRKRQGAKHVEHDWPCPAAYRPHGDHLKETDL